MNYNDYLKNKQLIAYKIFENAFKNQKVFHAYLLSGEAGTPLLEIAKYLAKSLVCLSPTPFACDECSNCKRIDNEIYGDLIIIDGRKSTIHKEDIQRIETEFSKTSLEKKGIKIYIINLVENMNLDSINALLKFLEEPSENTYAFLTTENEFRVLPTILSRTQVVRLNLIDKKDLISESEESNIPTIDAELLSNFYNDVSTIKEASKDDCYQNIKNAILELFDYISDKERFRFFYEKTFPALLKTTQNVRLFFDILIFIFKESYVYSIEKETIFKSLENLFKIVNEHYTNLDLKIIFLMDERNELNYNININLLLLHVLNKILKMRE